MNVLEIDYDQGCEYSWSGRHKLYRTILDGPPDESAWAEDVEYWICYNGACDYLEEA